MEIENVTRFKGFPWYNFYNDEILIGGAGGIGSWLSFFLARAGFKILLHDDDVVEDHNIGGQFFDVNSVGMFKVDVVSSVIKQFTGEDISTSTRRLNLSTNYFPKVFFSCFDNMKARKETFIGWKGQIGENAMIETENLPAIYIDGRLSGELLQIFCINSKNPEAILKYEQNELFDDSEVEDLACTLKQTTHSAAMIASHMVGFFTNHVSNTVYEEDLREVPYLYEYLIPGNLTIDENI